MGKQKSIALDLPKKVGGWLQYRARFPLRLAIGRNDPPVVYDSSSGDDSYEIRYNSKEGLYEIYLWTYNESQDEWHMEVVSATPDFRQAVIILLKEMRR